MMAAKRSRQGPPASAIFDELLVTMALGGDRAAAQRLHARWNPRLLRTARRLSGDGELAAQVAQESWLAIWRGLGKLRDPARFGPWAFGIVRRKCANAIARRARSRAVFEPGEVDETPSAATQEDRVALDQAFAALSPEHRLAAHLHFVEGLTLAEIAEAQEVPLGTAKSRLFHARRQLKAALTETVTGDET